MANSSFSLLFIVRFRQEIDQGEKVPSSKFGLKGVHRIEVRDDKGDISEAVLELRDRRMLVLPPVAKAKEYGSLELTVLHAEERGTPKGRERISWKLLTDLPVRTLKEAIEKLKRYALRWKIGLSRLTDIVIGFSSRDANVGS